MKKNLMVVPRISSDETTVAVVQWEGTTVNFLRSLRAAVTEWMNTTEAGRQSWEETSHDFNVGDLADVTAAPDLVLALARQGINKLDVQLFSDMDGERDWTYDTVLRGTTQVNENLDPFQQWMVRSNLQTIREQEVPLEEQVVALRINGYPGVAQAVEDASKVTTGQSLRTNKSKGVK